MPDRRTPTKATMHKSTTFTRILCAAALSALALLLPTRPALAADYTDIWFTPAESGWGVNLVQSDAFIYATFFIYGADGKPTWLTATLSYNESSAYSGAVYSYTGTYYANAWDPAKFSEQLVGIASFQPSTTNNSQGTLTYTVVGAQTVVKPIQRQTLTTAQFSGNYYGGEYITYSGCKSSGPFNFTDSYGLTVTQSANALTLVFAYDGLKETCTMSGVPVQNGLLYSIPTASYTCTGGLTTTASIYNIKQTGLGIEGQFSAPGTFGDNCQEDTRFSAVRQ
jgi:hypothetical protein